VRSHEAAEARLARRHGVACLAMPAVRRLGLGRALRRAVAWVTASGGGFGISLDLDALDPRDAPAVGTPVPGGLRAAELVAALETLCRHPGYLGFELAEYNPTLDRDGRCARLVRRLLWAAIPQGGQPWNA
jgi:arginase